MKIKGKIRSLDLDIGSARVFDENRRISFNIILDLYSKEQIDIAKDSLCRSKDVIIVEGPDFAYISQCKTEIDEQLEIAAKFKNQELEKDPEHMKELHELQGV